MCLFLCLFSTQVVPEKIVEREGDLEAVNVIGQGLGKENDVLALAHHVIKKGK